MWSNVIANVTETAHSRPSRALEGKARTTRVESLVSADYIKRAKGFQRFWLQTGDGARGWAPTQTFAIHDSG
jgi:hypothetical protein